MAAWQPLVTGDLYVEVSDSSLSYDCRHKTSLYAQAGVPEYWVVNLWIVAWKCIAILSSAKGRCMAVNTKLTACMVREGHHADVRG